LQARKMVEPPLSCSCTSSISRLWP